MIRLAARRAMAVVAAVAALAAAVSTAAPAPAASAASGAAAPAIEFSAAERARILSHGPWPPPPAAARDAGNAWSGRPDAVALGQRLFFDRGLSPSGRVACSHCHDPARAWTDGHRRSVGLAELDRNAPSLWNAVFDHWQGWDGAADSLWSQALRPLADTREMASSPRHLRRHLAADADYACRWQRLTGRSPAHTPPGQVWVGAAKALGAFMATLVSPRTPFDDFRDALAAGDAAGQASYPPEAQRGLRLFIGRGRCHQCHLGPRFTNGEFADIGLSHFVRPGVVDRGRQAGLEALRASAHTRLSRWADAPTGPERARTAQVLALPRHFGEFKVPGLRQAVHTAPYMHDGQLATLDDVLAHYSELDLSRLHSDGERVLEPLHLSAAERADLKAFVHSLSAPGGNRWEAVPPRPCAPPGPGR